MARSGDDQLLKSAGRGAGEEAASAATTSRRRGRLRHFDEPEGLGRRPALASALVLLVLPLLLPAASATSGEGELGAAITLAEPADPHAFMSDPARCAECHTSDVPKGPAELVLAVDDICMDCHDEPARRHHAAALPADLEVPNELPLGAGGRMHCATCHDPHSPHRAAEPWQRLGPLGRPARDEEGRFRTFRLRRPNLRGELCLSCHANY